MEPGGFLLRWRLCVSRRLRFQRSGHATGGARRSRSRLGIGHHRRRLPPRRVFKISGRIADLPSTVVRLGTLDFMLRRRVANFTALVAEIESQIFSGIGFLLAVAEAAIER